MGWRLNFGWRWGRGVVLVGRAVGVRVEMGHGVGEGRDGWGKAGDQEAYLVYYHSTE